MVDVTMPQLGETVTEGTITRWIKKVGDQVAQDDVLFEVSTDKVDSEVPSLASGTLTEILVEEGQVAPVGTKIAVIGDAGEVAAADEMPVESQEAPTDLEPKPDMTAEPKPEPSAANDVDPSRDFGGAVLSPIVRRLLAEQNIDRSEIAGSGVGGRITRADVEAYVAGAKTSASKSVGSPAPSRVMPPARAGVGDTVIPFNKIRQKTAEHMLMSKATSAHTLVTIEVDYSNVDRVRNAHKKSFKQDEGISLTYLPFIARALVDAIDAFPHANASVGENELIVHRDVNIGVAVDINFEGLLVPVVHNADGLRLKQLARNIADLAYRARNKKLQADDIQGGTFTITNAGGYGTLMTYPVINQPQVAILSTDGVKKRPVVIEMPDGTDAIVVRPVGILALAWDHRAFDGAYAAAFLKRIKDVLEERDWSGEIS